MCVVWQRLCFAVSCVSRMVVLVNPLRVVFCAVVAGKQSCMPTLVWAGTPCCVFKCVDLHVVGVAIAWCGDHSD